MGKAIKFSKEDVYQEMVNYFIKNKVAIAVRGKGTVVPTSVDDLSPRMKKPTRKHTFTGEVTPNKEYVSARNRLHYRAKHTPKVKVAPTKAAPREERVENKDIEMTITLPSNMSAREFINFLTMIKRSGAQLKGI